ncbi:HEAT repeat domain-containing protein [Actinoplanes solisilvae]|uniref:HEAT repeat domain-containing protein n=1 Tax=Actinoplanes solisilvae TaxID=2486853 RepID=UPI000FDCAA46|nr:hypothetical protein [Actinoplanes solisilvae]
MVDWSALRHAYGPAEDVPGNLAALSSPDEQERHDAFGELWASIVHQGNRYSASAAAVPLLLDLVADPSTPDRWLPLHLLGVIAVGPDEAWLPGGVRLDLLGEDETRAYEAVRAGLPVLRDLVADEPSAAYLLGWYPGDTASLEVLAAQDDPTAVVAIGLLGLPGGVPIAARALTDERPLMRWAGAIASARLLGPGAGDGLLEWLTAGSDPTIPYLAGDLGGYALLSLSLVGADLFEPALIRLAHVTGDPALTTVGVALNAAFPDGPVATGTPFRNLTDRQQRVVEAVLHHRKAWLLDGHEFGNVGLLISDYGLPHGRDRLAAYVNPATKII